MLSPEAGNTWYKLSLITGRAKRDKTFKFTSLAHLLDLEFLRHCFCSLDKKKAVGIDNMSWEDYNKNLEENLSNLITRLKRKSFKPLPSKRIYIPKLSGGQRPLGISAIESKIVERGLTCILESIFEHDFLDRSYGFRPGRNCHQALKALNDLITFHPVNHVVEADIKGFFDNVSHEHLMNFIKVRIADPSLHFLLERFLKAGYTEKGNHSSLDKGTPQGSILSPLLANIYLHFVLDIWFETTVKNHTRGFCELVRYADDFVCVVRYHDDAIRIETALHNRFNKFGLELNAEKTRRFSFGHFERRNACDQNRKPNTFNFLGFTHFCDTTRNGLHYKVGRVTERKKFAAKCKEINLWLKGIRNQCNIKLWWKTLKAKLSGHFQYFGVSENSRGISRFHSRVIKMAFKWLNRRSQRRSMNWEEFQDYLKHYPLPKPRIVHNFYASP